VTLDDAVESKRLPGGDLERPVLVLVPDLIHQEPLLRVTNPSRHPDTNYEHIGRFDTLSLTVISDVTVVLLVDPWNLVSRVLFGRVHQWYCRQDPERLSPEDTGRRL